MKIEIFEIDFGTDGDLYFVTTLGNQIIIPGGEYHFERWCDNNGISEEKNPTYPKIDNNLLKEFAMLNREKWEIEYDHNGEYYGNAAEFVNEFYSPYAKPL